MVMCGKNNNDSAKVWARIPDSLKTEVQSSRRNFKFPGRGQSEQPVIQFQGAIKLLMWLPGEQAKVFRSKAADILTRYFAGDKSLLEDIAANAESTAPVNELARAALPTESKKRKAELEELEVFDRRQTLEERRQTLEERKLDFIMNHMNAVAMLGEIEERDKVAYRALLSITLNNQTRLLQPAITNGDAPKTPTSIQIVVNRMKVRNLTNTDYQQIGRIMKNKYVAAHGFDPTKHKEVGVNGKCYNVNDYYEDDEPMIKEAVEEFLSRRK
jgi:hypothetical protein